MFFILSTNRFVESCIIQQVQVESSRFAEKAEAEVTMEDELELTAELTADLMSKFEEI